MSDESKNTRDPNHSKASNVKLNSLRAAVLGANDGVVSVSSIILGVAGATSSRNSILAAGIAGLAAGALSMAAGEYVSVSSQRDTEHAFIKTEKWRLRHHPEEEFNDLAATFERKGLTSVTARQVAQELTEHDAIRAHLDAEFSIDEEDLSSPAHAALASLAAFILGGLVPLCVTLQVGRQYRLLATVAAVLATLALTGYASATVSRTAHPRVIMRVVAGGAIAMLITFSIGTLFRRLVG
jgi:VIT1/CCC1 family predicted Fe2+/Mn2+ transporter